MSEQEFEMRVNRSLFERGGSLGRGQYLINSMYIFVIRFGVVILAVFLKTWLARSAHWTFTPLVVFSIAVPIGALVFVLSINNDCKRVRDIQGRNEVDWPWIAASVIPYVSMCLLLYLAITPGLHCRKQLAGREVVA